VTWSVLRRRRWHGLGLCRFTITPATPDGVIYPSRLNEEANLAVYDRAIGKLRTDRIFPLIDAPGFAVVLDSLNVALV